MKNLRTYKVTRILHQPKGATVEAASFGEAVDKARAIADVDGGDWEGVAYYTYSAVEVE